MTSPEDVYREFVARIHRTMAAYLAMIAWTRNLDCVAIDRDELVGFWGISKRVENQRLEWLKGDIKPFFPHVKILRVSTRGQKFGSVFLSRREFPSFASVTFPAKLRDEKRAQFLTKKGFITAVVSLPSEVEMLASLSAVIHGLASLPAPALKP